MPVPLESKISLPSQPEHLLFLVPPSVHLLDLAGPAQVLTHPRLGRATPHYLGIQPTLRAAQGLDIQNLEPLPDTLPPSSWLLVVGGCQSMALLHDPAGKQLVHWLSSVYQQAALTACICSGALLAARAGLLDGRTCTTHHSLLNDLRGLAPRAQVLENRLFVQSDQLWTSAGISSGIDLCLHLVAVHYGYEAANQVARDLVLYHRRTGSDPQIDIWLKYRNHINQRLHRIQDRILQNPGYPWTVKDLAADAHISTRHLTRLFHTHTGLSLKDYLQQTRLALAKRLLQQATLTVDQVAEALGYQSARQFRRLWQKHYGESPRMSVPLE